MCLLYLNLLVIVILEALARMGSVASGEASGNCCLAKAFTTATIEAHAYYMFSKVMDQLSPLYDPTPGPEGTPAVVSFCGRIQGILFSYSVVSPLFWPAILLMIAFSLSALILNGMFGRLVSSKNIFYVWSINIFSHTTLNWTTSTFSLSFTLEYTS